MTTQPCVNNPVPVFYVMDTNQYCLPKSDNVTCDFSATFSNTSASLLLRMPDLRKRSHFFYRKLRNSTLKMRPFMSGAAVMSNLIFLQTRDFYNRAEMSCLYSQVSPGLLLLLNLTFPRTLENLLLSQHEIVLISYSERKIFFIS